MRKNSMDMGQVLAAEAPDPEMKRAEMQMEKGAGGRNAGPGSINMEKSPGSKMNTAGSAGKKKGIRNVHKKKGN